MRTGTSTWGIDWKACVLFSVASVAVAQERDEPRVRRLIELTVRGDPRAQSMLTVLGRRAAPLVAQILIGSGSTDDAWRRLGSVLLHMGPEASGVVPMLISELQGERRDHALALLSEVGPWRADLPRLIRDVMPESPLGQESVLWSRLLSRARIDPEETVENLVKVLESEDPVQRVFAIQILGHRGPDAAGAVAPLLHALRIAHPNDDHRGGENLTGLTHYWTAWALKKIAPDDPGIVPALAYSLKVAKGESNASIGREAAMLLGQMGPRAVPALSELVEAASMAGGQSPQVAYEAITALGMMGPAAKGAVPALEKLCEVNDLQISERAKAALKQIKDGGR